MSCILYIKEKEDNKIIASSCFISKYHFEVKCVCVHVCVCVCVYVYVSVCMSLL